MQNVDLLLLIGFLFIVVVLVILDTKRKMRIMKKLIDRLKFMEVELQRSISMRDSMQNQRDLTMKENSLLRGIIVEYEAIMEKNKPTKKTKKNTKKTTTNKKK